MDLKTRFLVFHVLKLQSTVLETIKNEPSDPFYWKLKTQPAETVPHERLSCVRQEWCTTQGRMSVVICCFVEEF